MKTASQARSESVISLKVFRARRIVAALGKNCSVYRRHDEDPLTLEVVFDLSPGAHVYQQGLLDIQPIILLLSGDRRIATRIAEIRECSGNPLYLTVRHAAEGVSVDPQENILAVLVKADAEESARVIPNARFGARARMKRSCR